MVTADGWPIPGKGYDVGEFEKHEHEPLPVWHSVELTALRQHGDAEAAELRQTLPILLAGIVGEVRGAELQLQMLTDDDGMVGIVLAASAGDATPVVADELAVALEPVADAEVRAGRRPSCTQEWPVIIEGPQAALGFTDERARQDVKPVPWRNADERPERQLIEDLVTVPGCGLRLQLRADQGGIRPTWAVQLSVVTTGAEPPLRLRAAIRRRFAGLEVAASPSETPVWLQVGAAELADMFAVPVAGSKPLPGVYTTPAAPIAMTRPRPCAGDQQPGLRIGHAVTSGNRPLPVELSVAERLRHVHLLGQTGTGKSSALAGIVGELALRGEGALIADPHGQLCDRVLAELPERARERVWLIRCGDIDNPVPMNPLAEPDPVRQDIAIADLCDLFGYLFDKKQRGIAGPRFTQRVGMTLRALAAAHGTRASLLDVPAASADTDFMETAVSRSNDDRLKVWWRVNKLERRSNEHGEVLAWVNSKFETFSNTAAMRGILGSGADAIDFVDAMDAGRIILLDLSKAELGEASSRLLGFMYLNRVWHAALRRRHRERPFTVMVDEAHTLISGALTNMLAEGRKFGLSVILAHQYLEQLDEDLRPAVDGNVATTIAFRSAVGDVPALTQRFGGLVESTVLVTQPELTAICLRAATTGLAYPHSVIIDHNDRVIARCGVELAAHLDRVLQATHANLVEPYRSITSPAVRGVSNIEALTQAGDRCTTPAERGVARGPGRPATPTAPATVSGGRGTGSFLDEWLTKHAKTPATAAGQ